MGIVDNRNVDISRRPLPGPSRTFVTLFPEP